MKYQRPDLPESQIEYCLDNFTKEEAKKRILAYLSGVYDSFELYLKTQEIINDIEKSIERLKKS